MMPQKGWGMSIKDSGFHQVFHGLLLHLQNQPNLCGFSEAQSEKQIRVNSLMKRLFFLRL